MRSLESILTDPSTPKIVVVVNSSNEYYLPSGVIENTNWVTGLGVTLLPSGGYRSSGISTVYNKYHEIWTIVE